MQQIKYIKKKQKEKFTRESVAAKSQQQQPQKQQNGVGKLIMANANQLMNCSSRRHTVKVMQELQKRNEVNQGKRQREGVREERNIGIRVRERDRERETQESGRARKKFEDFSETNVK